VEGLVSIYSGVLWIIAALVIPETYAPLLLRKRAQKLSQVTGKVYRSTLELGAGTVSARDAFSKNLLRPWTLLLREPIVLLLSLYVAIVYGTLYMQFAAFPIVFQQIRGWNEGVGALPFMSIALGCVAAVFYNYLDNKRYMRIVVSSHSAPPEARLPPAMVGSIAIPIGLFWFAWTNYASIHWIVCTAACVPYGFGMVLIIVCIKNYLVDSYTIYAASVLAGSVVLRSVFGAAFPLFTTNMYQSLGIHCKYS
jgi:hypothetical protein